MAIVMDRNTRRRIAARGALAVAVALAITGGQPAFAQANPRAAGQPVAPPALENLNTALDDLATSPNDVSALLRAGWASLNLSDTQAALGFFRRAEQASPTNGEAKAGEASALLRLDDPVNAVKLFAAAEAAGTPMTRFNADRGLALDLVGQNVAAQRLYRQALTLANDPETVRRLALSLAIMGDERGAEATLLPLLQHRDLAAYRTRAFALAILGRGEDAVAIAQTMLPANLSNRMAPYLRYMPRLTRAQQAAAANLGEFPPASEIGRDSPEVAALSAQNPRVQVAAAGADSRLVPAGEPLGRASRRQKADKKSKKDRKREEAAQLAAASTNAAPSSPPPAALALPTPPPPTVRAAVQQQQPVPQPVQAAAPPPAALVAAAQQPPAKVPVQAPPQVRPAPMAPQLSPAVQASAPQPAAPVPQPPVPAPETEQGKPVVVASLSAQPATPEPAPPVEEVAKPSLSITPPAAAPAEKEPVSLADAFADFATAVPAVKRPPDAVDITKIQPTRPVQKAEPKAPPKEKTKAKPKPPANPSRIWVQLGTGRDVKALGFTWRRLQKDAGPLLAKHDAYSAKWGATRRLVTGPYKSDDEAQAAVKALKKKGLDAFQFTSDEGEEVAPLK